MLAIDIVIPFDWSFQTFQTRANFLLFRHIEKAKAVLRSCQSNIVKSATPWNQQIANDVDMKVITIIMKLDKLYIYLYELK